MITINEIRDDFDIYKRNTVILWGCGIFGGHFIDFASKADINIEACCDNDEKKWGTKFHDIPVISPKELESLSKEKNILVQLSVQNNNEILIETQLKNIGITNCVERIKAFFALAHIVSSNFFDKYPHINEEISKNFVTNKAPLNSLPDVEVENLITICQPPKTGDNTIIETCKANKIPYVFLQHDSNRLQDSKKLKLTVAIRDPLSRDISGIFQSLEDGRICINRNIKFEDYYSFLENQNAQHIVDKMLANFPKKKSTTCNFFETFKRNCVDVLNHPFDQKKGYTIIQTEKYDIFFYQLEKLNDLVPELSDWVGVPFTKLVNANEASSKWIASSYQKAQKELKFSQEYFDACYNDPYVQHCYSESDIEKFKDRWLRNIDPKK